MPPAPAPAFRLVAFDTCADLLAGLKAAAKKAVGPWGFGGDRAAIPESWAGGVPAMDMAAPGAALDKKSATPAYSGTNTHEAGVDEPDLVKTDGRRIVTVTQGVLRVVDPVTRRVTGRVDLGGQDSPLRYRDLSLLMHGDRAVVLLPEAVGLIRSDINEKPAGPSEPTGPTLLLVDLSGQPKVVGRYHTDGGLVDARQVGGTVRVVVRAHPRIDFRYDESSTTAQRIAANRKIIESSGIEDWLPRYEVTTDGRTETGRVPCDRLSHPPAYSGAAMLTLLTFDLTAPALTSGDPVTVMADGDTVYGTASSLYVASDQRWRFGPVAVDPLGGAPAKPAEVTTQIHRFDLATPGRPRYAASGEVPGWLINQYAMSEWNGHLRVATTNGRAKAPEEPTSSAVYVLKIPDGTGEAVQPLREVGRVTGLGRNERIYAVRFLGDTGYVVTFRQTDPLYTLDLRDPAKPRVTGEVKISGYSAYLHQVGDGRLLGIGQDADLRGRVKGAQVSLFDVRDPARPVRIAQYRVAGAYSEAEFDPHAFLFWPADGLLVVPVTAGDGTRSEVLALRVGDRTLGDLGRIRHPAVDRAPAYDSVIRRSLVVGDVLWTLSDAGLMATRTADLRPVGWVPLT
ncbi:MAG TPA: beta-propeller domain-containing protein [Micromonosporaceae bacterium]